jgi:hypothetical protein
MVTKTKLRSHMLQREYAGERLSAPLLEWLNLKRRTSAHRRIERLLVNLALVRRFFGEREQADTDKSLPARRPYLSGLSWSVTDFPDVMVSRQFAHSRAEARKELSRHRAWPDLGTVTNPTGHWKGSRLEFHWNCGNDPASEAVLQIVLLGREGTLWRVRRCLKCGLWFYAKFHHQKFCRTACQQEHYKKSPEWREVRRKYMQRYRRENY